MSDNSAIADAGRPGIDVELCGRSDVGCVREHNEDAFLVARLSGRRPGLGPEVVRHRLDAKGSLFVVCDGMGGAAAGEIASQMAVHVVFAELGVLPPPLDRLELARRLRHATLEANRFIYMAARRDWNRSGMGTTCTAAALIDKHLLLAQVGDSRGYLFRRRQLAQLTRDQSLVAQLIEAHQLTPEEAKAFEHSNIILQALGVSERVEVDISTAELRRGDVLLLCSDGLHGPVTEPTILHILEQEPVLENACDRLIEAARAAGGPDNITAVLVRFSGNALEEPAGETEGTQPAIPFLRLDLGQVDAYPLPPPLTRRPATQMEQIDKLPAAVREELVLARAARRSESARQAGGDGIPGCAAMSEGGSRQHLVATAAATAAVAAGQGWGVARETTDGIDQAGGGNGRPAGEFQAASEAGDGLSAAAAGALEQAAALDPEDLELRRPWSMGWLVLLVVVLAMLTGLSLTYLGRSPAPAATPRPAGHGPSASQASGGGR